MVTSTVWRILLSIAISQIAHAAAISYTFDGFASGSVDSAAFTDSPFSITLRTDTAQVTHPFPTLPFIFATGPAETTIDIAGIGSGAFLSGLSVYVHQRIRELGLTEPGANDLFALREPVLVSYDLRSSLGPITEPFPEDFVTFVGLETTIGRITLSDFHDITFTAAVAEAPVPEPNSCQMLVIGVGAFLTLARARFPVRASHTDESTKRFRII
jgi:hypothetical protein